MIHLFPNFTRSMVQLSVRKLKRTLPTTSSSKCRAFSLGTFEGCQPVRSSARNSC